MNTTSLKIDRLFSVTRQEQRGIGKFTDFGFESNGVKTYCARIDGHPPLKTGNYIACTQVLFGRTYFLSLFSVDGEEISKGSAKSDFAIGFSAFFTASALVAVELDLIISITHPIRFLLWFALAFSLAVLAWFPWRASLRIRSRRSVAKLFPLKIHNGI